MLIYNLIVESYNQTYRIDILNNDIELFPDSSFPNYGEKLLGAILSDTLHQAFEINIAGNYESSLDRIKSGKSDVLVIIPGDFSEKILNAAQEPRQQVPVEFIGNITGMKYMVGAVWIYSSISTFITGETGMTEPLLMEEKPVGLSGNRTDFELAVPGLLIFSIIMLMLSASSAMVYESENRTLDRLKMSGVPVFTLLGGISVVQLMVGFLSVALTLFTALLLGFRYEGSLLLVLLVASLTTLSVIAFCLIIAAFSKTVTQVLVVGNFPLFVFMFFSGAMFPIPTATWFSIAGYDISLISLLSPSHGVNALHKVMFMQQGFSAIVPELVSLFILTVIYAIAGGWLYYRMHLRVA